MRVSYVALLLGLASCGKTSTSSSAPIVADPAKVSDPPAVLVLDLPAGIEATIDGDAAHGHVDVTPDVSHVLVLASPCDRHETTVVLTAGETVVADAGPLLGELDVLVTDERGDAGEGELTFDTAGTRITAVSGQPMRVPACPTRLTVTAPDRGTLSLDVTPVAGSTTRVVAPLSGGSDMVRVPGGTFTMGPPLHALFRYSTVPRFEGVVVESFDVDRTEVTAQQYLDCAKAGLCHPNAQSIYGDVYKKHCTLTWTGGTVAARGESDRPATCLTRALAIEYCQAYGKRLITDIEWEFVALNGGTTDYPWGNEAPDCTRGRAKDGCPGIDGTAPPCSHPAGNSSHGICDLYGNVEEMTSPVLFEGRFAGHTTRGGYWHEQFPPFYAIGRGSPDGSVGFRCARSLRTP